MTFTESALRHMHEERLDRPDDEREKFEHEETPRGESERNEAEPSSPSLENPADSTPDPHLLSHAGREAERRKAERGSAPAPANSFIEKPNRIAAGPGKHSADYSDESLFFQYQKGDETAFFSIYERYKSSVYAYCAQVMFSAGMNRETVEDTFQDVFLRLVQYRHTFTGGDFKPWLFTVTRHACLTAKRKFWRDHEGGDHAQELGNDPDNPENMRQALAWGEDPLEQMTKAEQVGLLLAAIAKLPDEFREALILSEYEELSYEDIAIVLGISMSTVRIRIFRAKAKLRKMLLPVLGEGIIPGNETKKV